VLAHFSLLFLLLPFLLRSYVGNKASNFPLQLLGFDVDPLHSCQLSNHTNYPGGFRGQRASGEDVSGVEAGLRANDLLREYSHVLTGYMTSIKFLEQSVELIKAIREARPDMLFGQCCTGAHKLFFSPPFPLFLLSPPSVSSDEF
jgi:pyridoxal kinase